MPRPHGNAPAPDPTAHCAFAVRPATVADLDAVNQVVAAAVDAWGLPQRVLRLALPSLLYSADDLGHMQLTLAHDGNGNTCGVVAWETAAASDSPPDTHALMLHGLYVSPHAQRRGIGARLLELTLDAAKAHGLDGVVVRAWREAEAYFLARDFAPIPERDEPGTYPRRLWRAMS